MLSIAAALGLAGVVIMFVGNEYAGLSLAFFLAAGVPAGIALGTQDKEYYFY